MQTISELLRRTRLEQGIDLATVAAQTRINAKYLRAIEADDSKSLPGSFFYKSFVHQYATCLGLDTKAIDAEVDRVLSAEASLPLPGNTRQSDQRQWFQPRPATKYLSYATYLSFATVALVLVASVGIDAWWHKRRNSMPVSPAPVPRAAAGPTVAEPVTSAAMPGEPQTATGSRIELALTATENTWLSVSSDGTPVFSGFLEANQTKTIEGKETANLRVGNAAGLEVRLNGTPLGSLGAHGQVRDLAFTSDKVQFISQRN
jgi:cytoskeleton protein RodZ